MSVTSSISGKKNRPPDPSPSRIISPTPVYSLNLNSIQTPDWYKIPTLYFGLHYNCPIARGMPPDTKESDGKAKYDKPSLLWTTEDNLSNRSEVLHCRVRDCEAEGSDSRG